MARRSGRARYNALDGLLGSFGSLGLSERHNVSRVPELDYFVRKLAKDGDEPQWDLPYGKAGSAVGLPTRFSSAEDYMNQAQAHTALEFQVSYLNSCTCVYNTPAGPHADSHREPATCCLRHAASSSAPSAPLSPPDIYHLTDAGGLSEGHADSGPHRARVRAAWAAQRAARVVAVQPEAEGRSELPLCERGLHLGGLHLTSLPVAAPGGASSGF